MKSRLLKIIAIPAALIIIGAVIFAYSMKSYTSRDHASTLLEYRTHIISIDKTLLSADTVSSIYRVRLTGETLPGLTCYLRIPFRDEPSPVMILLGGLNTGKEVIHLVGETDLVDRFIFMSMDYPYEGKKKDVPVLEFLRAVPAIQKAVFNSVSAVMLMVDYLETVPEADPDHIFLTGASFGSFFAIAAGALDPRIQAVASLYGGGDISLLIAENIHRGPRIFREAAGLIVELLLLPVEPLRYVEKIAPHHFLMVNGKNDEQIPSASVKKLYEAARQPKELVWYETKHIRPTRGELTQELTEIVDRWIEEKGLLIR